MELYKVSKKLHRLTEISIITNTDGIHSSDTIVGYIAEDPFVVLCSWIDKYIISFYNQKIYPVGHCSFEYTVKIKDIGSIYEPANISKFHYRDIESFENLNGIMHLAILTEQDKEEYYRLLKSSLDSIPDIQKAIDNQDIINSIYNTYKGNNERIKCILDLAKTTNVYGKDYKIDLLIAYAIKVSIEKSYESE